MPPHRIAALAASALLALRAVGACAQEEPAAPSSAPQADSIIVNGRRLGIENRIDRKVYTVTQDVQSSFGSVGDILTAIPSVDVDSDGIVSLRGDTHVLILIDGKPTTQFSGASAGENLQSIPAADIERIEVMTNPPPQYKAEGTAGVINIITRRRHRPGFTGTLQGSRGSGGRSMLGTNAAWTAGPLSAELRATYRQDYKRRFTRSDLIVADPAGGAPTASTTSTNEIIRRTVPPLDLRATYALGSRDSLDLELKRTGRAGLRTYSQRNDATTPAGALTQTGRFSAGHDREIDGEQRLGFTHTFARPGETLELTLDHSTSSNNEHYDYTNVRIEPAAPDFFTALGFHEKYATTEATADYARPLTAHSAVKGGAGLEQEDYDYAAARYTLDMPRGPAALAPGSADDFRYRQRIGSLYLSGQTLLGKWSAVGGLRAEYTDTQGRQLLQDVLTTHHYAELFPSVHLDRALTDRSTLSLGASRRVTRPDPDNMDPYIDYEYAPNLHAGNPNLRPQFTQSYELGWSFEGRALSSTATGYYRRNRDTATEFTQPLGNGLVLTRQTNLPQNTAAGLEFTLDGHLGRSVSLGVSGNLFRSQIDATALGAPGLASTTGVNGKVKLDWRPGARDAVQILATRTARRLTPQGYVSAVNIVNLGWRHQIGRDLTAIATVSDLFNGQRFERVAMSPGFTDRYSRRIQGRIAWFGLICSFGSQRKDSASTFGYDE